ncbi:hypothetical protein BC831DRAFT_245317 [Entophlyctis helioformis]|nr:hypothetical protein BC831DRAFT_245317 [Entophlyctis helioformis]
MPGWLTSGWTMLKVQGTSPGGKPASRHEWLPRVVRKGQDRTTDHVRNFTRVVIRGTPTNDFSIVVDRRVTIEYLAQQIEAEFAYRCLFPPPKTPDPDASLNASMERSTSHLALASHSPFQCGFLYDHAMMPLRFQDLVGDVLEEDSIVTAVNIFDDDQEYLSLATDLGADGLSAMFEDRIQAPRSSHVHSRIASNDNVAGRYSQHRNADASTAQEGIPTVVVVPAESLNQVETSTLSSSDLDISNRGHGRGLAGIRSQSQITTESSHRRREGAIAASLATLDSRFQLFIRNSLCLDAFHTICIEHFAIENLLFWLDVEVYRQIGSLDIEAHRLYICLTYIAPGSPLEINIADEIRRDIMCGTESANDPAIMTVFDEAQERIYALVKGHTYAIFERSKAYANLKAMHSKDERSFANHVLQLSTFEHKPSSLRAAVRHILNHSFPDSATLADKSLSLPHLASLHGPVLAVSGIQATRSEILDQVVRHFFPDSPCLPIEGYFNDRQKTLTDIRQRRVKKERLISKFFGQHPSAEQLKRQLDNGSHTMLSRCSMESPSGHNPRYSVTKTNPVDGELEDLDMSLSDGQVKIRLGTDQADSADSKVRHEQHEPDQAPAQPSQQASMPRQDSSSQDDMPRGVDKRSKMKKAEKLQGIFGEKLPSSQLVGQNLANPEDEFVADQLGNSATYVSQTQLNLVQPAAVIQPLVMLAAPIIAFTSADPQEPEAPAPVTVNTLDAEEKRVLTRRSKKATDILGEKLDEELASQIVATGLGRNPAFDDGLPRLRLSVAVSPASNDRAADVPPSPSAESISSRISDTTSPASPVYDDSVEREYRRKKLRKLHQFLGERLPPSMLEGDGGTTGRASVMRPRSSTVGERPNAALFVALSTESPYDPSAKLGALMRAHKMTIRGLERVITDKQATAELVRAVKEFDSEELQRNASNIAASGPTGSTVSTSSGGTGSNNSLAVLSASRRKPKFDDQFRQSERRVRKISQFFGDELSAEEIHQFINKSLISDIERTIMDDYSSGLLSEEEMTALVVDLKRLNDSLVDSNSNTNLQQSRLSRASSSSQMDTETQNRLEALDKPGNSMASSAMLLMHAFSPKSRRGSKQSPKSAFDLSST